MGSLGLILYFQMLSHSNVVCVCKVLLVLAVVKIQKNLSGLD